MKERSPEITLFEGAATSDPIPVEKYSGSLKKTIEFFGRQELGRFSINTQHVIKRYEHDTCKNVFFRLKFWFILYL